MNRGANRTARRGLDGLRARAWAKFGFTAPRKSSVLLTRGAGAFSFTRATTATVEDWEGAIRVCKSGEVRFPGARRVRNLCVTSSENLMTGWSVHTGVTRTAGQVDPLGGTTAIKIVTDAAGKGIYQSGDGTSAGAVLVESVWLRGDSSGQVRIERTAGGSPFGTVTIDSTWKRYAIPAAAVTNANSGMYIRALAAMTFYVWRPQVEDVTGQSNQNPSEYVSVGAFPPNGLLNSEEIDNAVWTKDSLTVSANATLGPTGAQNADKLEEDGAAAFHYCYRVGLTTVQGETYCLSWHLKAAERSWAKVNVNDGTNKGAWFDLQNGVVGTVDADVTAGMQAMGGGWFRCWIVRTQTTATGALSWQVWICNADGAGSYLGTVGSGIYAFGAQLEKASSLGSYSPVGNVYPYHGACVDGVKYFEHQNGNTVASNVVTEAMGATLTTCKGRLDETASTNLVLQSSNFGTTWTAVGTPTRTAAAKYCGDIALDLLGDDDGGATEQYNISVTFTGDAVKSMSAIVAQGSATTTCIGIRDDTAGVFRARANITWSSGAPVVTPVEGTQERPPEALGNGCYRVFLASTSVTAANSHTIRVYPASATGSSPSETGTIYIGGMQAENATTASSHIPTTTGTVTRNADAGSYPSVGNVSASGGTLYLEYEIERDTGADQVLAEIGDSSSNERITFYRGAAGGLTVYVADGGAAQCVLNLGTAAVGSSGKIAVRWAANDFAGVMTGGAIQTDASGTLPTVTAIFPGNGRGTAYQAQGPTKNLRISQQLLSNAELLALVA